MAVYAKKMFGIFVGREEIMKLKCSSDLVGVIIDHLGKAVMIVPVNSECFTIHVDI